MEVHNFHIAPVNLLHSFLFEPFIDTRTWRFLKRATMNRPIVVIPLFQAQIRI